MSRNIRETHCMYCPGEGTVALVEEPRPILEAEANGYFDEYDGLIVAKAECRLCEAKYLAWVDSRQRKVNRPYWARDDGPTAERPFFDLSFRSTFNDEPGDADMPTWNVERVVTFKKTPWVS